MAVTQSFVPEPPSVPKTYTENVVIPPPLQKDPPQKTPMIQKAMQIGMPIIMVAMMVIMMRAMGGIGGRQIMMMMMMGMMMLMMVVQMLSSAFGGGSQADTINADRQNYFLTLEKSRKKAHEVGSSQHRVQTWLYPNPHGIAGLVRNKHRTMWAARPHAEDDGLSFEQTDNLLAGRNTMQSADTWLKVRIGTGLIDLSPRVQSEEEESVAPEMLEPVTFQAFANFMTAQNVVPLAPISKSIDVPAVSMRGDMTHRRDFVRSMLCSFIYNHSPANVMVGVVCDKFQEPEWEWIKWLPHNANRFEEPSEFGFPSLKWGSILEASTYLAEHRKVIEALRGRVVIIVDTPDDKARPIPGTETMPGVTWFVVDSLDDSSLLRPENRFHLSSEGKFSAYDKLDIADVDFMTVDEAEEVAREMSRLRPPGFVHLQADNAEQASSISTTAIEPPTILEVMGTQDLESYPLVENWHDTDGIKPFKIPIGFRVAQNNQGEYVPTGEIQYLDILQKSSGGTGPHGLFQGGTGTGKSFLIVMVILMLCTYYSPRKLVIISADFKGGSTFNPLADLPHFIACLTNLNGALDMVDRARDMLLGEHQRRMEVFKTYGVVDIFDYRKYQKKNPEQHLEDIPDMLFVADEFRAFIVDHPEYKDMFTKIAAEGRSTGIHLLIGSQTIDNTLIDASAQNNYDYGISLKVREPQASTTVIRSSQATTLPPSKVAYLYAQDLQDESRTLFQGFNHSLPYVRHVVTSGAPADITPALDVAKGEHTGGDDNGFNIKPFTLTGNSAVEKVDEGEVEVVEEKDVETVDTGMSMFDAIVDMVKRKSEGYTTLRTYWLPPLTVPRAVGEVDTEVLKRRPHRGINILLGDIDLPYNHRREALEVGFGTSSNTHYAVVGSTGTGRSTAIRTMITTSALRYSGREVSWLLYDYQGNGLSCMRNFPNVSMYAEKNREDTWVRMLGEIRKVVNIRRNAFSEHDYDTMETYFARRDEDGVMGDNYQWLLVALDGFGEFATDIKMDLDAQTDFISLMKDCATYGIYFVATVASAGELGIRFEKLFTHGLRLYTNQYSDLYNATGNAREYIRPLHDKMPPTEPGRVIDSSLQDESGQPQYHHGRVYLPIPSKPEPIRVTDRGEEYDQHQDVTQDIIEFGESITKWLDDDKLAYKLELVSTLTTDDLYDRLPMELLPTIPQPQRALPLGINTSTGDPELVDFGVTPAMRHVIIAGSSGTGRTTTLRTLMRSAAELYAEDTTNPKRRGARFMIVDLTGGLTTDANHYAELGYMKKQSMIVTANQLSKLPETIEVLAMKRALTEDKILANPNAIVDRSYFVGPEVFVFIDNANSVLKNGFNKGPIEQALMLMPENDIGVHFIIASNAATLPTMVSANKGIQYMTDALNPLFLLHSGQSSGAIITSTKTRFKQLPVGRVQLFNRDEYNSLNVPQVQVAFTPKSGE